MYHYALQIGAPIGGGAEYFADKKSALDRFSVLTGQDARLTLRQGSWTQDGYQRGRSFVLKEWEGPEEFLETPIWGLSIQETIRVLWKAAADEGQDFRWLVWSLNHAVGCADRLFHGDHPCQAARDADAWVMANAVWNTATKEGNRGPDHQEVFLAEHLLQNGEVCFADHHRSPWTLRMVVTLVQRWTGVTPRIIQVHDLGPHHPTTGVGVEGFVLEMA